VGGVPLNNKTFQTVPLLFSETRAHTYSGTKPFVCVLNGPIQPFPISTFPFSIFPFTIYHHQEAALSYSLLTFKKSHR